MNSQMKIYLGPGLGGFQVPELLSPWSWGTSPCRYMEVSGHLEAPPNTFLLGFLWKLHHKGMITHPFALSGRWDGWGDNSKLLLMAWSILVTRPDPGAHPKLPQQNKRWSWCSYHSGIYKGFRRSIYMVSKIHNTDYMFQHILFIFIPWFSFFII